MGLFQVDVEELINNKFLMMVQGTGLTLKDINGLYYWEYELYIKLLNKKNKEENDSNNKQQEQQTASMGGMGNFNPSKIMGSVPKIPKF